MQLPERDGLQDPRQQQQRARVTQIVRLQRLSGARSRHGQVQQWRMRHQM